MRVSKNVSDVVDSPSFLAPAASTHVRPWTLLCGCDTRQKRAGETEKGGKRGHRYRNERGVYELTHTLETAAARTAWHSQSWSNMLYLWLLITTTTPPVSDACEPLRPVVHAIQGRHVGQQSLINFAEGCDS